MVMGSPMKKIVKPHTNRSQEPEFRSQEGKKAEILRFAQNDSPPSS